MPVPTETMRNIKRLNVVFAATGLLTLISMGWMFWHDYHRRWRDVQTNFFNVRSAMAHFDYLAYQSPDEQAKRQGLEKAVQQAEQENSTDENKAKEKELLKRQEELAGLLQGAQLTYGNLNAEMQVRLFNYEEAKTLHGEDNPKTLAVKAENEAAAEDLAEAKAKADVLEDQLRDVRGEVKKFYRRRTEAQKALAAYDKGANDAEKADAMYGPGFQRFAFNMPLLDYLAPQGIPGRQEVKQVFSKAIRFDYNFVDSYVTDRCMTCHVGIDDPAMTVASFVQKTEAAIKAPAVVEVLRSENEQLIGEMKSRLALAGASEEPDLANQDVAEMTPEGRETFIKALVRQANEFLEENERPVIPVQEIVSEVAKAEGLTRGRVTELIAGHVQRILWGAAPMAPGSDRPLAFKEMSEPQQMSHVASLAAALNAYLVEQGRPKINFSEEIRAHPHLDLYLSPESPHPLKSMGCTVCHEGAGQDTDFVLAAHTPKNKEEMRRWQRDHYVKELGVPLATFHLVEEFWERPMLLPGYTSASCRKCHDQTFDLERYKTQRLASAERIVEGRNLYTMLGCINCHNVDGLSDSRQVGTDLTHVKEKLSAGFMERWIAYPNDFRPSTLMPHFFRQENSLASSANEFDPDPVLRGETEISAITHYLRTFAKPLEQLPLPEGVTGDPARGEQLFVSTGCLGCHANLEAKDPLADSGQSIGERWIVAELMQVDGLSPEDAKSRFDEMSRNDRVRFAMRRFTPERRREALIVAAEEEFAADRESRDPDAGKMYVPAAFTRIAPELSGVGTKLAADPNDAAQVQSGMKWLVNWLRDPRHYSSYTKMPRMFRDDYHQSLDAAGRLKQNDQDIMDVAAYLLSLRNDDFVTEPFPDDERHRTMQQDLILTLLGGQNTQNVSEKILADDKLSEEEPYGRLTSAIVAQAYKSFGEGDEGKKIVAEIIEHRSGSLVERQKLFLGMKAISHYGCNACHAIPGFEGATRPGTDLTLWAQKFMSQLDFAFYSPAFEHEVEHQPEVFGRIYIDSAEYENLVRDAGGNAPAEVLHNHASFAYHKLRNPRIWDRAKIKKPYEKLKMPNFFLSEEEARSLTTYLLSLRSPNVTQAVRIPYDESPAGKVARGRALVRELNCIGCHSIEGIEGNEANIHQYYSKDATVGDSYAFGPRFMPPLLWGEGAKVQYDWLFSFLNNVEMLRPWLNARMPSFHLTKEQATTLVEYFAGLSQQESAVLDEELKPIAAYLSHVHSAAAATGDESSATDAWFMQDKLAGQADFLASYAIDHRQVRPYDLDAGNETDPGRIAEALSPTFDQIVARAGFLANLFRVEYPFSDPVSHATDDARFKLGEEFFYDQKCLACHVAGDPSAPGTTTDIKAPNFALTHRRLRYDWVYDWLQDPQAIQPGANMPQIFQGGSAYAMMPEEDRKSLESKFGDSIDRQATLLVDFLFNLGERRYTAIQPGGLAQPAAPAQGQEAEFDFDGGEEKKETEEEPKFDFDQ